MRSAVTEDTYLLACTAPLGAMASLVEMAGAFGAVVVSLPLFGAVWELLSGMI